MGCFILRLREDNLFFKTWVQWEYHLSASGAVNCHVSLLAKTTNETKSAPDLHHSKLILVFFLASQDTQAQLKNHSGKRKRVEVRYFLPTHGS